MKLLVIANRIPSLNKKGDQIVAHRRLLYLAKKGHSIHLICFGDYSKHADRMALDELRSQGIVVELIKWSLMEAIKNLIIATFNSNLPFQCAYYKSSQFYKAINKVSADAIYCITVRAFENIGSYKGKIFCDLIDSMGLNFERRANMSGGVKRWLLSAEAKRISNYEKMVTNRVNHSFVVSNIDQKAIGSKKVSVIKLGVDVEPYRKNYHAEVPIIVFTGNMNYQPNVDAILWFILNCWPVVKKNVPGAMLMIVGNNPRNSIVRQSIKDSSIKVTGFVSSVIDIIKVATIAIAPMHSGSGMQFKILEAMACGVPVVTTTLGLGDIGAKAGRDIIIADDANTFSDCVLSLISNEALQRHIGEAGLKHIKLNHSWDVLNESFEKAITNF